MEVNMPGDPKECRQHALNCVHLAKTAKSAEARDRFAHLARTWIRLAEELERMQAVLADVEDEQELEQTLKRHPLAGRSVSPSIEARRQLREAIFVIFERIVVALQCSRRWAWLEIPPEMRCRRRRRRLKRRGTLLGYRSGGGRFGDAFLHPAGEPLAFKASKKTTAAQSEPPSFLDSRYL